MSLKQNVLPSMLKNWAPKLVASLRTEHNPGASSTEHSEGPRKRGANRHEKSTKSESAASESKLSQSKRARSNSVPSRGRPDGKRGLVSHDEQETAVGRLSTVVKEKKNQH